MMECFDFIESQYGISSSSVLTKEKNGIQVFPNPAKDVVTFSFVKEMLVKRVTIKNMAGEILKEVDSKAREITVSD